MNARQSVSMKGPTRHQRRSRKISSMLDIQSCCTTQPQWCHELQPIRARHGL